jgi:hypothetical protein
MMKRPSYIIGAAIVCAITFIVYFAVRPPRSITPMGDESSATIAWISLAGAIVSLVGTMVGLVQKVIELRADKGK